MAELIIIGAGLLLQLMALLIIGILIFFKSARLVGWRCWVYLSIGIACIVMPALTLHFIAVYLSNI